MLEDHTDIGKFNQGQFLKAYQKPIQICFQSRQELMVLELCSCCLATNIRLY